MNSRERFLQAIQGIETDRPPYWFMRQAGRHLPEYKKIREGKTFEDFLFTPNLAVEATLQPVKRYDTDAAIIFSDILLPFYGCNRELQILPGKGPRLKPLENPQEITTVFTECDTSPVFEPLSITVKHVREALPHKAVIGFAGAPYTLASYFIEGKSTKDSVITKAFAYQYPKEFKNLLEHVSTLVLEQLQVQVEAGADVVQIFDSWAYHLSVEQYEKFVHANTKALIQKIRKQVPVIYYSRGTRQLFSSLQRLSMNVLSIDHSISLSEAKTRLPSHTGVQGNLDPAVLLVPPSLAHEEVSRVLNEGKGLDGFVFNLSQGIHQSTPPEHVHALVKKIQALG